jgi:hypothetical protein
MSRQKNTEPLPASSSGARADEEGRPVQGRYSRPGIKTAAGMSPASRRSSGTSIKTDFAPGTHVRIYIRFLDWTELNIMGIYRREGIPTVSPVYNQRGRGPGLTVPWMLPLHRAHLFRIRDGRRDLRGAVRRKAGRRRRALGAGPRTGRRAAVWNCSGRSGIYVSIKRKRRVQANSGKKWGVVSPVMWNHGKSTVSAAAGGHPFAAGREAGKGPGNMPPESQAV